MLTKKPAQTARSNGADRLKNAPTVPLSVQNVRANEQPLYNALARLHQEQPEVERYTEELARLMLLHLAPVVLECIQEHISDNRVYLAEMWPLPKWGKFFQAGLMHWLKEIFIPEQIEIIGAWVKERLDEDRANIAYSPSRAAMLAVTFHSSMGQVSVLCAQMVIVATGQDQDDQPEEQEL